MKKFIVLIVFLFLVSVVYVSAAEVIEEDIGEYKYIRARVVEDDSFFPSYRINYEGKDGKSIVVVITEFNDEKFGEDYLGRWISNKIKSDNSVSFQGNYIFKFSTEDTNNLMWRSNNFYIQIKLGGGYSDLPDQIIKDYLEVYPSGCDNIGCSIPGTSDISEYKKIVDISKQLNSYRPLLLPCPKDPTLSNLKQEITKYVGNVEYISKEEFTNMLGECSERSRFAVSSRPVESELQGCIGELNNILQNEDIPYTDDNLLKECVLRSSFQNWLENKSTKGYSTEFFTSLFKSRDIEFLNEIKAEYEYKKAPKMVIDNVDGNIVKKLVTIKENCTPSRNNISSESDILSEPDCYEEEIIEIVPDSSEKEVLATAQETEIKHTESEENLFTNVLRFMRIKLNPLNWFD